MSKKYVFHIFFHFAASLVSLPFACRNFFFPPFLYINKLVLCPLFLHFLLITSILFFLSLNLWYFLLACPHFFEPLTIPKAMSDKGDQTRVSLIEFFFNTTVSIGRDPSSLITSDLRLYFIPLSLQIFLPTLTEFFCFVIKSRLFVFSFNLHSLSKYLHRFIFVRLSRTSG